MVPFLSLFDLHVGHERRPGGGRPTALHDAKAIAAVWKFAAELKPQRIIFGGDVMDCGSVSHHNKGKPGKVEGLRLSEDFKVARDLVVGPAEAVLARAGSIDYLYGNHEDWIQDVLDENPALEDLLSIQKELGLNRKWTIHPQGSVLELTKHLLVIHGDQISGGVNAAKTAVDTYDRCIRLGHTHTYQSFTKTSPVSWEQPRTGVVVPCLCHKNPAYMGVKPNRWVQGFNFGYLGNDGTFTDFVVPIINGKFRVHGKEWVG